MGEYALLDPARKLVRRVATDRELRSVVLFSLVSVVGGFFGNRLLTQVAQPRALGSYYLYANLAQWLSLPAAAGFLYVVHHWPIAREHGDTRRFSRALAVAIALQVAIAIAGSLCMRFVPRSGVDSINSMLGVALLAVATGIFQLLCPIPGAQHWRVWGGTLTLLAGDIRPFTQAVGILLLGAASGIGLLGSAAALQLIAATMTGWLSWRIFQMTLSTEPPRPTSQLSIDAFLSYWIPGFAGVLVAQVATSVERWGLARSGDTAATALFVQAMGLSVAATGAISGLLNNYFYPYATNAAAREAADPLGAAAPILKRLYALVTSALIAMTLPVVLFARPVTSIAFGSRFAAIVDLLPWTVLGGSLFALGASLTIALYIARDAWHANIARMVSQAIYIAALIFVPRGSDPARVFVRLYAGSQLIYLAIVCFALWRIIVARRNNRAARTLEAGPKGT